jgi:hypothetical protein
VVSPSDARRGSEDEHGESSGGQKDRTGDRTATATAQRLRPRSALELLDQRRHHVEPVLATFFRRSLRSRRKNVGEKDRDCTRYRNRDRAQPSNSSISAGTTSNRSSTMP